MTLNLLNDLDNDLEKQGQGQPLTLNLAGVIKCTGPYDLYYVFLGVCSFRNKVSEFVYESSSAILLFVVVNRT